MENWVCEEKQTENYGYTFFLAGQMDFNLNPYSLKMLHFEMSFMNPTRM